MSDNFGLHTMCRASSFTVVSDRLAVLEVDQGGEWVDAEPAGRLDRSGFDKLNSMTFSVVVNVLKTVECHFTWFTTALSI